MKKWLLLALSFIVIFLLLFLLERGIFLLYFFQKSSLLSFSDISGVFIHGLWLDFSLSCYLLTLPLIVFLIQQLTGRILLNVFLKIYLPVVLFIIGLLFVGDLGIYENWGSKLNVRAIQNFLHPSEMIASSGASPIWLYVLLIAAHVLYGWFSAKYLSKRKSVTQGGGIKWLNYPVFILMSGSLLLGIRGGFRVIPLNEGICYFSKSAFANHATINSTWYSMQSIVNQKKYQKENPYKFMTEEKAKNIVQDLYETPDSSFNRILKTSKPNIVFIQLESFGADIVEELNGWKGVTPRLSQLIHEGFLFENIYASGFRTDQGLVAMLSGFPAQPNVSIIWHVEKQEKLPTLTEKFESLGYSSEVIYAGDINFSNMNAYVVHNGFDKVITINDFSIIDQTSKWGVYDHIMFERAIREINQQRAPFFTYLITLSSHEPYEIPTQQKFPGEEGREKYLSSIYYTDGALGKFFDEAKKHPWYANTLFILCADHGHWKPFDRSSKQPPEHRVPLLMVGGALNDSMKDKRISSIGNQTDIASTLLHQLNISAEDFLWSKNLLNPSARNFTYLSFDNGFGWVSKTDTFSYDVDGRVFCYPPTRTDINNHPAGDTAKAYLQSLFDAYIRY